jgi:alpha-beta hydrolase superfamily lysophospholipase
VDAPLLMPYDTVRFQTSKGLSIDGWLTKKDSAKGVVILFHGISVTKSALLDEANEFYYEGYNVFLLDFRGHGNSEGNTTTIGAKEAEEVQLAYDYCHSKGIKNIFLYGSSMGAVSVARAIAEKNIQPAGVILEMPFGSLQSYLKGRARILGFPRQPFAFLTTFWIGMERGFNGYRHSTVRFAKKIKCPVLLQWGNQDILVLENETRAIYEAIPGSNKKLVIYNGAQHESFLRKDPLKWRIEVNMFLNKWTSLR